MGKLDPRDKFLLGNAGIAVLMLPLISINNSGVWCTEEHINIGKKRAS